jgi:hypothetical protein
VSRPTSKPRRRAATGHARRPRRPLRHRLRARLPSGARLLAGTLFVVLLAGAVALVNGPWLRVGRVAAAGAQLTAVDELDALLDPYRGTSLLTFDSEGLASRLRLLPAVARVEVSAQLPDTLDVRITEKAPAFAWLTRSAQLLVASDGSVVASLSPDGELPASLSTLPLVDDQRSVSRRLAPGDRVPASELATAGRLLGIDPGLMGSASSHFQLRLDDEYGFILVSHSPDWKAALGFYQLDPQETAATAGARLDAQIAAIRTLFSAHRERNVSWVDARNPGKVYWAP